MVGYRCVNVASTAPNILSLGLLLVVTLVAASDGAAQTSASVARERSGEELFRSGCAACHGVNGRGGVREQIGFDDPLPDFTACDFATPEPDSDWLAIVHQGGPVRAFSRRMPAFRDLLSDAEIERVVDYLRGFCRDPVWPRGDLNLPRPLVTEKAFPENEALFTTAGQGGDAPALGASFIYERRLGRRSQYEVQVPIDAQKSNATWTGGLGDITLAFKHVIHADLAGGRILSAGAELLLPTGSESRSLGKGTTIVEPFLAFGQILPADAFVEAHTGIELPADTEKSSREVFFSAAIGKSYTQDSWGRSWSPMVEFVAAREMADGEPLLWDAVPQLQVTLSRRQHIMISGGVRTPINRRSGRDTQFVGYFLWDWFDGGLFQFWK
jgi:mono/diheme cytochrome c family protein